MAHKLAIDFGTTNSVIARWNETAGAPEVVTVPKIGAAGDNDLPPVVPSLIYIRNGGTGAVTLGQQVRDQGLDLQKDNRLFRNFKRGIVSSPAPEARTIDGQAWGDHDAGKAFVHSVLGALPFRIDDIEQLVLTAPVASFEGYLAWLNNMFDEVTQNRIHIVDESTAAALGYAVTKPGAVVLVFDFGGGTLDISLVELPESREKTGGILKLLRTQQYRPAHRPRDRKSGPHHRRQRCRSVDGGGCTSKDGRVDQGARQGLPAAAHPLRNREDRALDTGERQHRV